MKSIYETTSTKEYRGAVSASPERELLIAALDRAVLDYFGAKGEIQLDADEWIFGDADASEAFTFDWVCEHLGLSASAVRLRIRSHRKPGSNSQVYSWIRKKVQSRSRTDLLAGNLERLAA